MRSIRVGRDGRGRYVAGVVSSVSSAPVAMTDEQKARFMESLRQMPRDKWVSALRSVGMDAEADDCEREIAEEQSRAAAAERRAERLSEIMAMDEGERLPLLVAEGYDDAADELREKMAAAKPKRGRKSSKPRAKKE